MIVEKGITLEKGLSYSVFPTFSVEYLVVGGGGGGGSGGGHQPILGEDYTGGGGGAGGLVTGTLSTSGNSVLSIIVGSGGTGASGSIKKYGANGASSILQSSFLNIIGLGGGGGGWGDSTGYPGGSGGGPNGVALQPSSSSGGFGNNGGTSLADGGYGGAGGGSFLAGKNWNDSSYPGVGGTGNTVTSFVSWGTDSSNSIAGPTRGIFAGGGSAGNLDTVGNRIGSLNGGGGGATTGGAAGSSGITNTGGGGGGGGSVGNNVYYAGGSGGSGIVLFRYPSTYPEASFSTFSPIVSGGYRYYAFTSSGYLHFT